MIVTIKSKRRKMVGYKQLVSKKRDEKEDEGEKSLKKNEGWKFALITRVEVCADHK